VVVDRYTVEIRNVRITMKGKGTRDGGDLLCVALAVLYIPMSRFASSNISFLRNILKSVRERYIVYTPERDDNELCILVRSLM